MTRLIFRTTLLLACLATSGLAAQEDCPRIFPVQLSGLNFQFFDEYEFKADTGLIPGLQSGELCAGDATFEAIVNRRVAERVVQTVPYTVRVFVDGRFVYETRTREVVRTVFRTVQETQLVELPPITGRWYAIDFCTFSWWNFVNVGAEGIAIGAGTKSGETLHGTAVFVGVSAIPTGVYRVSNRAE